MFQFDLLLNAHCKANSILILLHKNKGIGRLSSIRTRPSIWGVIGYRMVPNITHALHNRPTALEFLVPFPHRTIILSAHRNFGF